MSEMNERVSRERGGILLHDYTQDKDVSGLVKKKADRDSREFLDRIDFHQISRGLVWLSLGLGAAKVIAPERMQKMIGVRRGDYRAVIRWVGVREFTTAFLTIADPRPYRAAWTRAAGSFMDLGLLSAATQTRRANQDRLMGVISFVFSMLALDLLTATQLYREQKLVRKVSSFTNEDFNHRLDQGQYHVSRSITILKSPEELYQFWRNFENLPRFMVHLQTVQVKDDRRSHWVVKAPAGTQVEWDAEITQDLVNQRIAWQSTGNADVPNSGSVTFTPAASERGTVVRVEIAYQPPVGAIGRTIAQLFGEAPAQQVKGDLYRLKQVMETGEVMRSSAVPAGLGQKTPYPGQPSESRQADKQRKGFLSKLFPSKRASEGEMNKGQELEWQQEQPDYDFKK